MSELVTVVDNETMRLLNSHGFSSCEQAMDDIRLKYDKNEYKRLLVIRVIPVTTPFYRAPFMYAYSVSDDGVLQLLYSKAEEEEQVNTDKVT